MNDVRGFNNLLYATRQWLYAFNLIASLISLMEVPSYSSPWNEKQTRSVALLYSCVIGSYVCVLCGRPPVSSRPRGLLSSCSVRRSMIGSSPFRTKSMKTRSMVQGWSMRLFILNGSFASIELSSVYQSHVVNKWEKDSKIRRKLFSTSRKLSKCWTTKRGQRWKARRSRSHTRSKNNSSHTAIDYFLHTIVHFFIEDKHDLPFQYISAFILSITPLYLPWHS